jgi:hypothetical protein
MPSGNGRITRGRWFRAAGGGDICRTDADLPSGASGRRFDPRSRLAIPGGLEPPTSRLEGGCSVQLSYGTVAPFCVKPPRHASVSVMKTEFGSGP